MAQRGFPAALLIPLALALLVSAGGRADAQQITRVAVIDLPRVVAAFPQETQALKQFEARKSEIQAEADKRATEIKALQAQKSAAEAAGEADRAQALDADISRRTEFLREYVRLRQAELEIMAKALGTGQTFLQRLSQTIRQVAEAEGYSIVLNSKGESEASPVLWYSGAVDITDKTIQAFSASSR